MPDLGSKHDGGRLATMAMPQGAALATFLVWTPFILNVAAGGKDVFHFGK